MPSLLLTIIEPTRLQVGNNRLGVSGVSWKASILVCKALDSYGDGTISDVVECLDWCT